ncbi:MAG: hypothetical protein OTI36_20795, partial [Beijerinckiaceae bacterium]|nr:hypothetical protein [Beijerinckiaceae bacterium]
PKRARPPVFAALMARMRGRASARASADAAASIADDHHRQLEEAKVAAQQDADAHRRTIALLSRCHKAKLDGVEEKLRDMAAGDPVPSELEELVRRAEKKNKLSEADSELISGLVARKIQPNAKVNVRSKYPCVGASQPVAAASRVRLPSHHCPRYTPCPAPRCRAQPHHTPSPLIPLTPLSLHQGVIKTISSLLANKLGKTACACLQPASRPSHLTTSLSADLFVSKIFGMPGWTTVRAWRKPYSTSASPGKRHQAISEYGIMYGEETITGIMNDGTAMLPDMGVHRGPDGVDRYVGYSYPNDPRHHPNLADIPRIGTDPKAIAAVLKPYTQTKHGLGRTVMVYGMYNVSVNRLHITNTYPEAASGEVAEHQFLHWRCCVADCYYDEEGQLRKETDRISNCMFIGCDSYSTQLKAMKLWSTPTTFDIDAGFTLYVTPPLLLLLPLPLLSCRCARRSCCYCYYCCCCCCYCYCRPCYCSARRLTTSPPPPSPTQVRVPRVAARNLRLPELHRRVGREHRGRQ